jgi:hypothetical protein
MGRETSPFQNPAALRVTLPSGEPIVDVPIERALHLGVIVFAGRQHTDPFKHMLQQRAVGGDRKTREAITLPLPPTPLPIG